MMNTAFLDRLASARSDSDFSRTAAGLKVLQVYESVKANHYDPVVHDRALRALRCDIDMIQDSPAVRAALTSIVEALPFWNSTDFARVGRKATYTALLQYGKVLGDESEWLIAENVFALAGVDSELDGETWLAAEARLMMGRASRMVADWESSRIAYNRAHELGLECRDMAIALRAQVGQANNLWMRGDIPAARKLLAATARRARATCPAVLPRIRLAAAGIANAAGDYDRAIHLAFELLKSLKDDDELAHHTLVDLAIFFTDYGLPPVAAEALRLVERSAPQPRVRRQAKLNLLYLSARHDSEAEFENRRSDLGRESLVVREKVQLALFSAFGMRRFGRFAEARAHAERAVELANSFELSQLALEAEDEVRAIEAARKSVATGDPDVNPRQPSTPGDLFTGIATSPCYARNPISAARTRPISRRVMRIAESLSSMAAERFAPTEPEPGSVS